MYMVWGNNRDCCRKKLYESLLGTRLENGRLGVLEHVAGILYKGRICNTSPSCAQRDVGPFLTIINEDTEGTSRCLRPRRAASRRQSFHRVSPVFRRPQQPRTSRCLVRVREGVPGISRHDAYQLRLIRLIRRVVAVLPPHRNRIRGARCRGSCSCSRLPMGLSR